jgi:hypothetical protein
MKRIGIPFFGYVVIALIVISCKKELPNQYEVFDGQTKQKRISKTVYTSYQNIIQTAFLADTNTFVYDEADRLVRIDRSALETDNTVSKGVTNVYYYDNYIEYNYTYELTNRIEKRDYSKRLLELYMTIDGKLQAWRKYHYNSDSTECEIEDKLLPSEWGSGLAQYQNGNLTYEEVLYRKYEAGNYVKGVNYSIYTYDDTQGAFYNSVNNRKGHEFGFIEDGVKKVVFKTNDVIEYGPDGLISRQLDGDYILAVGHTDYYWEEY